MYMHYNVSGALASGIINVHMTRGRDDKHWMYYSLALDVPGQERVWLENVEKGKMDDGARKALVARTRSASAI